MVKSSESGTRGVSNIESRSWDAAEYERRALEREDRERGAVAAAIRRRIAEHQDADDFLNSRTEAVDFLKDVGSRRMIDLEADGAFTRQGYHCELCQRTFTDNKSYIVHINSAQHQSRLGKSMAVRKATLSEVRQRIRQRIEAKYAKRNRLQAATTYDFEARVHDLERIEQQQIEARAARKKQRKEEHKRIKEAARKAADDATKKDAPISDDSEEQEMMAVLGFSGFGSSKQS